MFPPDGIQGDPPPVNESQPPAPQAPEPPVPEVSPWQQWQQAGIDPSLNPYDVRRAYEGFEALQDRSRSLPYIESILRANGHLPDGVDLREGLDFIRQYAQEQADPWAALGQQPDPYGQPDPYQQQPGQGQPPAGQGLDPYALQQAVEAAIDQRMRAFQESQAEAQRQAQWESSVGEVARQHNLDQVETSMVSAAALTLLNQNPTLQYRDALEQAHQGFEQRIMQRMAALGQQQQQAPQVTTPQGNPPAAYQPPADIDAATRMVMELSRQHGH